MQKLMKQMQKAQVAQEEIQERLAGMSVTGSAGGGVVTVTANGHGAVNAVRIDKAAVDPDDVESLEDLVLVAVQDAQRRASELQQSEMQKLMGSLGGLGGMR